jgi:hypothetical protein
MELKSKGKKPKYFEKIRGSDNLFKSYIHNFNGCKKLIAALHHIQKAETLYVTSQITTRFMLERNEDFDILEFVGDVFNAFAYIEGTSTEGRAENSSEGLICTIYFMDDYKKTKTYIFQYIGEFYKGWISAKLPLIIGRNRNLGMARLRFISLYEDTNKILEENLGFKASIYCIPNVYKEREARVKSIVFDL